MTIVKVAVARLSATGQVVDRQGRPLATVEELTAATTPGPVETERATAGIYVLEPGEDDSALPTGSVIIRKQ